jgi:hypothetical protein
MLRLKRSVKNRDATALFVHTKTEEKGEEQKDTTALCVNA